MKKACKQVFPYVLISFFVIAFWLQLTCTTNFAWNPKGNETLILSGALTNLFLYKSAFWLVIVNGTFFIVKGIYRGNYKTAIVASICTCSIYFLAGQMVDKKCAFHYYSVFHHQSVKEEYLIKPVLSAGYHIGPILTERVKDKEMKYRRYAITGLGKLNYTLATPALIKLLFDKAELVELRADALQALSCFDTPQSRNALSDFRQRAMDNTDKKVIELAHYNL